MSKVLLKVVGLSQPEAASPARLAPRCNWLQRRPIAYLTVTLVFFAMAGRLLRLTYRYAVNIFFWDQWGFHNADLFQKHSLWQMFRWQYGPHRLGLGPLLSTLVEPYLRWNSRSESFLACSIVILAAACALWLKQRLFGEIVIWDVAIPILYLSAAQYESLFITSDLAHGPLPLLLITLYCLAWTIEKTLPRYATVLALNFVTIYTGFGLFLGFLTPLLLISDYQTNLKSKTKGALYATMGLLICVGSLASFFIGYTLQPAANCFSLKLRQPVQYLWYVSLMFANIWIKGVGWLPRIIGFAVLLCLLWALLSATRKAFKAKPQFWKQHSLTVTLIAYSFLFCASTAIGRLCLGLGLAQSSRYVNYLVPGIVGLYLYLVSIQAVQLRSVLLAMAVAALLATVPIRREDRGLMESFRNVKQNWRNCYLGGGNIATCDKVAGFKIDPEPERILQQKLKYSKDTSQNLYSDVP